MAKLRICDNCKGAVPASTGWISVVIKTERKVWHTHGLPFVLEDYCSIGCLSEDIETASKALGKSDCRDE